KGGTRQIVVITDGEPTAYWEPGHSTPVFSYPPTPRTLQQTLLEVGRCTREGLRINTFMLERSYGLMRFVDDITRINRGRAFFADPERLGDYILVDYLQPKQRRLASLASGGWRAGPSSVQRRSAHTNPESTRRAARQGSNRRTRRCS